MTTKQAIAKKSNRTRTPTIPAYAFWEYDLFPYMVAGRVVRDAGHGYVEVEGYDGYKFKPIHVELGDAGRQLKAKLDALKAEKNAAENRLDVEYNQRLVELAPFVKRTRYRLEGT